MELIHKTKNQLLDEVEKLKNRISELEEIQVGNSSTSQFEKKTIEAIQLLATQFSSISGLDFFNKVCAYLTDNLSVDQAFIGKINEQEDGVQVISGISFGEPMKPFNYLLQDTPCSNLLNKVMCCYPSKIRELFPKDEMLFVKNIESYFGIPLFSKDGKVIGILVLLHSTLISNPEELKTLLQIFSHRVASEMERIHVEKKIRENTELTQSITDTVGDAIVLINPEGIIMSWNKAAEKIFGYTKNEIVHENLDSIIPKRYRKKHKQDIIDILKGSKSQLPGNRIEITAVSKSQKEFPIEFSLSGWDKNNQKYFTGIIRDISEKKEKDQALLDIKTRYHELVEILPEVVFEVDLDFKITYANQRAFDLFGYSREELVNGINGLDLLIPESKLQAVELTRLHLKGIKSGANEYSAIKKDGTVLKGLLHANLIVKEGKPTGITGVFIDITERKRVEEKIRISEEKYRKLFEGSQDAIFLVDVESGKYLDANLAAEKLTGRKIAKLKKMKTSDVTPVQAKERLNSLRKGKGFKEASEVEYVQPDGSVRTALLDVIPLWQDNLFFGIAHDITKRKESEKALRESKDLFAKLFQTNPGIITISTIKDSRFLEVNEAAVQAIGLPKHEIINKTVNEIGLFDDKTRELLRKNIDEKGFYNGLELNVYGPFGKIRTGLFHGKIIRYNNQDCLFQTVIDITTLKEAQKSLVQLNLAVQSSSDVIFMTDKEGFFTFVNQKFTDRYGYRPEDVIGKKTPVILKCEKQVHHKGVKFWKELTGKQGLKHECINRCIDGRFINTEASVNPILDQSKQAQGYLAIHRDITERIKAEKALQHRESLLSAIFNSTANGLLVIDNEGEITHRNKQFIQMWNLPEDLQNSTNHLDLLEYGESHLQDSENFSANAKGLFKSEESLHDVLLLKDGRVFELNTQPLIHENVVEGRVWSFSDITQQKQAEEKIRNNEQMMSLHMNQTMLGMIDWDMDFRVMKWNPAAEKIFGYSKEEALGKHASFIVPDAAGEKVNKIWNQLISSKGGKFSSNKNINKEGEILYCEWHNTPLINDQGEIIAVSALVEDITESKRAESIQKVLYNISNAVITTGNLKKLIKRIQKELGKIIDTTNFYVALSDPQTGAVSMPFFADEKDKKAAIRAGETLTNYVIDTGKSILATRDKIKKLEKLGKIEPVGTDCEIWLGVPLNVENRTTGVLVVQSYADENAFNESDLKMLEFVSDQISTSIHRKKTEENLIKALAKATESDHLKSVFLATISHELRTPLNAIIGFSEFINKDLPAKEAEEFGEIIFNSGNHLLSIVNDLFEITLIESGEMKPTIEEVLLKDVVSNTHNIISADQQHSGNKDIALIQSIPADLVDVKVKTDPNKLTQILTNLLKNAFKFTNSGSIEYGYGLIEKDENNYVRFFVKDTGIGIPKDKQKVVFDIFRQAQESNTRKYGGTGIGLSVAKRLTELLGGSIWLESEESKGSTFYFTIPYKDQSKNIEPGSEAADENLPLKKTVLIAEDDEPSYRLLKMVINEKMDVDFLWAENGQVALELCKSNQNIQLVLMDINMPVMDGYTAIQEIKKIKPDLPIIAQTAYAISGDREKAFEMGCEDYISKPINRELLIKKIESILK